MMVVARAAHSTVHVFATALFHSYIHMNVAHREQHHQTAGCRRQQQFRIPNDHHKRTSTLSGTSTLWRPPMWHSDQDQCHCRARRMLDRC
jgi:hypothetical protein